MDCKTARLLVDCSSLRPGELDAQETAALGAHLQDCSECRNFDELEKEADAKIARAMLSVPVPTDLHARISGQLNRRKWAQRHRIILRVAAAVLLLIGLSSGAYAWINARRPVLDLEAFAEQSAQLRPASADLVEKWFLDVHGIRTRVPRELNYEYLESCSVQELLGSRVPALLFLKGPNNAEVLILEKVSLNFDAALNNPPTGSGGITIELRADPSEPGRAYLLKYTGGTLGWLTDNELQSTT
jgi:hypothetical protein